MKKLLLFTIIFIASLFANKSLAQCVGTQSYTLTPAGPYSAGQTVIVNYTLNSFTQLNSNFIIAFDLNLGVGWASASALSAPGNPGGSTGSWVWDLQNTFPSGLNFGPGWRFQNTVFPNWGTSSTGPFNFSFQLTVGASTSPQDLSISLGVIDDCQSGGWSNGACCSVSSFSIYTGNSYTDCMDSLAFNYNPAALVDDGSCCYVAGCMDPSANNYDTTVCYNNGSCNYPMTYIPDDNFEQALIDLGIDTDSILDDLVATNQLI